MTHLDYQTKTDNWWMPRDTTCQFCGDRTATGYWMSGGDHSLVCARCAKDTLPALIADAIHLTSGHEIGCAQDALVEIERAYWRAIAIRLNNARPRVTP